MKRLYSILLAASLLVSTNVFAQGAKDVADARAATEHWMNLMDTEEYTAAWNATSNSVRKEMPKFAWNMLASATHMPLGELKSRQYKSADIKKATADKPDTISFEYLAEYEKNHHVRESVTTIREADGVWRISGYSINDDNQAAK